MQTTLKKSFSLSGITLHSGLFSKINVHPAPANTGIRFKRIDLAVPNHHKIIDSVVENISTGELCTVLTNKYGYSISTIEHLMSAFHGLGIDNALVDVNTSEIPILDGSSKSYVNEIEKTGIKLLNTGRKVIKILKPFIVGNEKAFIKVTPNSHLSIDYTISYNHRLINKQNFYLNFVYGNNYKELISTCRTFGFEEDVNALREKGLIKGGSIDNAIVLSSDGILNDEALRFNDEFVRHKILDAIGDMFIIGHPIVGHIEAYCAGHKMMHEMLFTMLADSSLWTFNTSDKQDDTIDFYDKKEILSYI